MLQGPNRVIPNKNNIGKQMYGDEQGCMHVASFCSGVLIKQWIRITETMTHVSSVWRMKWKGCVLCIFDIKQQVTAVNSC